MLSVHSTNQSSLLPPHSFANDAVWRLISRNIGKKCTTPCFFTEEFCFASANSPCLPMPRPSISWCVANLFSMPLTQRSESENPGFPAPYTVWKVSQDRRGRFVTETGGKKEAHSYEQLHSVELLLPVRVMTYDMIRHTAASLRWGAEALGRMFFLPRREGGA